MTRSEIPSLFLVLTVQLHSDRSAFLTYLSNLKQTVSLLELPRQASFLSTGLMQKMFPIASNVFKKSHLSKFSPFHHPRPCHSNLSPMRKASRKSERKMKIWSARMLSAMGFRRPRYGKSTSLSGKPKPMRQRGKSLSDTSIAAGRDFPCRLYLKTTRSIGGLGIRTPI